MSTQSLSSVATHVVGRYGEVGKLFVAGYRTGAQRLAGRANSRYAEFVNSRSLPLVNGAVKASLIDVQQQVSGLVEGRIANVSRRAEQAIDRLAGRLNDGIQRVAATAERVEAAFDTTVIAAAGRFSMPAAQVSLEIANRTVEGAKRLSARLGSPAAQAAEEATVARAAKKSTRRGKARAHPGPLRSKHLP